MLPLCLAALLLFCPALVAAEEAEMPALIVAHDATWPPMEFINSNKEIVGYSVDYIDAVAKEANFTVEHRSVAWDGIFSGIAAKRYDIISSSVTITEERKKAMDFSDSYCEIKQAVVVPIDSTATTLADLTGKNVGGQLGTIGFMNAKKIEGAVAKGYPEIGLAMEDLRNGRLQAVICDGPVAAYYSMRREDAASVMKLAFIMDQDIEDYGFVVRKGNTAVLELLNKGIALVKEKGIDAELRQKWFGTE